MCEDEKQKIFTSQHSLFALPFALVFVAFTVVLLFVLRLSKMADCQG